MTPSRYGLWLCRENGKRLLSWSSVAKIVVSPIAAFLMALFFATNFHNPAILNLFRTEGVADPAQLAKIHEEARKASADLFWESQKVALLNLFGADMPPDESGLPQVQLWLDQGSLHNMLYSVVFGDPALDHDPGGNHPYFDGYYFDESKKLQKAKAASRGLSYWHHIPAKPSVRVKIRRKDIALGHRFVELQRPEDVLGVKNQISEHLQREMGGISGRSNQVRLMLNGKSHGVYLRTYRPGEALALMNERLPGIFFKGDIFDGRTLWDGLDGWNPLGEEPTQQELDFFSEFLELIRQPIETAEGWRRLARYLDFEAMATWAAVYVHSGSTHVDNRHNHVFFLSPYHGKLEPIAWDLNGYGLHGFPELKVNLATNVILYQLMHNPAWVHQRNLKLFELVTGPAEYERMKKWLSDYLEKAGPDLRADMNLGEVYRPEGLYTFAYRPYPATRVDEEYAEVLDWLKRRNETIMLFLNDAQVAVRGRQVAVYGSVAVEVDGEILYPGMGPFLANIHFPKAPRYYELASEPTTFKNAVTGEPVVPSEWPEEAPASDQHKSSLPQGFEGTRVLGPGRVEVSEDIVVEAGQTLRVEPGTELVFSGANLFSNGKVEMVGTEESPIVLRGGCIGLAGPGTAGSKFHWVDCAGGAPSRWFGVGFKGQFNAYECPELEIANCRFGANSGGDDAVNIAAGRAVIRDSRWENALSDGLDLDMVEGTVENCTFVNSGNDGIDMMTSQVTVRNCVFEGNGDKGASVGEASKASFFDSRFENCQIGIQVKDSSEAYLSQCLLKENEVAVSAYQKKPYYRTGGQIALEECEVIGSRKADVDLLNGSRLWLINTTVLASEAGVERVAELPDWARALAGD